ncbi:hypothetical protein F750_0012 [Streptomyces sp. PAMC 26508]|nr:hypothetical protein F750_0012 [Streptomyces sp. PAMC 26508]
MDSGSSGIGSRSGEHLIFSAVPRRQVLRCAARRLCGGGQGTSRQLNEPQPRAVGAAVGGGKRRIVEGNLQLTLTRKLSIRGHRKQDSAETQLLRCVMPQEVDLGRNRGRGHLCRLRLRRLHAPAGAGNRAEGDRQLSGAHRLRARGGEGDARAPRIRPARVLQPLRGVGSGRTRLVGRSIGLLLRKGQNLVDSSLGRAGEVFAASGHGRRGVIPRWYDDLR